MVVIIDLEEQSVQKKQKILVCLTEDETKIDINIYV
jgi:hypothetical protein